MQLSDRQPLAVLDLQPLTLLFGNNGSERQDMLEMFLGSCGELIAQLKRALEAGNWHAAEEFAHSAKGAASSTGAVRLGAILSMINHCLKTGEPDQAKILALGLDPLFLEVEAEISRLGADSGQR